MTPLIKLDHFYLKREDQNITGSAKDRAIPVQIKNLKKIKTRCVSIVNRNFNFLLHFQ